MTAQLFKEGMCFGQVFTIGTFTLKEIRNSIEPEPVYAHPAPEIEHTEHFFLNSRIIIIQVGLMMKEAMPVILLCHGVPSPVRRFKILENNAHVFILVRI